MRLKYKFERDGVHKPKVLDPRFLEHFIGFQCRVLYSRIRQQFHHAYSELGISTVELGLLMVVATYPESSQKDIADRVGVPRSVAVKSTKKLLDLGVIQRINDPGDRRHYKITLTEYGEIFVARVMEISMETHGRMLKGVPDAEAEIFLKCARKIVSNIDAFLQANGQSRQIAVTRD